MFKAWKEDTFETHAAIYNADYELTIIEEVVTDPDENKRIKTEILVMMPMFLDIFHYC